MFQHSFLISSFFIIQQVGDEIKILYIFDDVSKPPTT